MEYSNRLLQWDGRADEFTEEYKSFIIDEGLTIIKDSMEEYKEADCIELAAIMIEMIDSQDTAKKGEILNNMGLLDDAKLAVVFVHNNIVLDLMFEKLVTMLSDEAIMSLSYKYNGKVLADEKSM